LLAALLIGKHLLGCIKLIMSWRRGFDRRLTIVAICFPLTILLTVADILHLAVTIIRTAGSFTVTIPTVVIPFAAIVLARRVVATTTTRWRGDTATAVTRRTITAAAIRTRIKPPGC